MHTLKQFVTFSILIFSLLASLPVLSSHQPLWELGMGAGALHAPFYRGSNSSKSYVIPFPLPIYRGETFRSDDRGIYSKIFESEKVSLDISLAGNVPVPSGEVEVRKNMPGLDTVGEVGPELEINLWGSKSNESTFWLKLPLRAVFSIGDPLFKYQGIVFTPFIQYQHKVGPERDWWRFRAATGPMFGDSRYHNYFYEVDSTYETPNRPEHHNDTGYSGSRVTLSVARYQKNYFAAAFIRYDSLSGASFEDSPLVETNNYLVGGIVFAWIFKTSDTIATHGLFE